MSVQDSTSVAGQHAMIGNLPESGVAGFQRNNHPEAQWFDGAGLGLFLHFGIASVRGECDLSWGMIRDAKARNRKRDIELYGLFNMSVRMTPREYWAMAKDFTADRFDPARMLAAAAQAGFRYAVLTTKHHDGYALWPSRHGDLNIGQFQPGRDLVREYVEGCRAAGLKVGLYYSPPDWHFDRDHMSFGYGDSKPALDIDHRPIVLPERAPQELAEHKVRYRAFIRGQAEELLTDYGPIDVFWFDGSADGAISVERIRELQPAMLINNRGLGVGDFTTPECSFPKDRAKLAGWWWEYCHVGYDGGWGYRDHDGYKPAGWVLSEFVRARAWGGNFLPNYGPDRHGEMPEVYYRRMAQIGAWMQIHAAAVQGTSPGPWPETADAPVTIKGRTWFVHFDYLNDGQAIIRGVGCPVAVRLMRTSAAVPFTYAAGVLTITLEESWRTTLVDVVAVEFDA
jgi:alpha-L-fucosidase